MCRNKFVLEGITMAINASKKIEAIGCKTDEDLLQMLQKGKFDICLIDYILKYNERGSVDSVILAKKIKEQHGLKVVAFTNQHFSSRAEKFSGFDAVFDKNWRAEKIEEEIASLLNK